MRYFSTPAARLACHVQTQVLALNSEFLRTATPKNLWFFISAEKFPRIEIVIEMNYAIMNIKLVLRLEYVVVVEIEDSPFLEFHQNYKLNFRKTTSKS